MFFFFKTFFVGFALLKTILKLFSLNLDFSCVYVCELFLCPHAPCLFNSCFLKSSFLVEDVKEQRGKVEGCF